METTNGTLHLYPRTDNVNDWTVWGDGREPLMTGTEAECKTFVVDYEDPDEVYLQDPRGNEYEYDSSSEKWSPA